ncbi:MAG: hypothetical protein WA004_09715 [Saprospiraceae bacterium]
MPGPALHHLIAEKLQRSIKNGNGLGSSANYAQLNALLSDTKHLPYLFVGCQGPDILFFNTKDWPIGGAGEAIEIYLKVYDAIQKFEDALKNLVPQPILETLDKLDAAADAIVENSATLSELKQLFSDMQAIVDAISANLGEMVKEFISNFDLFNQLEHPYRDGQPKREWWWFDALHYRKTGRFAQALLDAAPPDSPLHLYALGYLTHFSGDTVGHPYVNINSGGPYRSHPQRHKTGENFQDVFNLFQHSGNDWNRSKIHALYNFNYNGDVSEPGDEVEVPDPNTLLPNDLAQMIADAINSLYESGNSDDNEYGRRITPTDVNNSYRLYYRWLKNATDTGTLPAPVPYSLTEELEEVWEKAMDNLGDIGDIIKNAADAQGSFSILGIFLTLAALIAAAVLAVAALIDAVLGSIATLTTSTIRYAASLIYDHLYNSYLNFRLGVSLNGLAFPMQEHMEEPRFRQFQNTGFSDSRGYNAVSLKKHLPTQRSQIQNSPFHQEIHLVYPEPSGEIRHAIGAPDSYFDKTSLFYAFGNIPLNKDLLNDLANLSPGHSDQDLMDLIKKHKRKSATIGNAMTLTEELFSRWKAGGKIPDFNLDADRGYAYPCWTQVIDGTPDPLEAPNPLVDTPEVIISFIRNE